MASGMAAAAGVPPWWRMPSALALVAADLVPVAGVLLAHWPVYPLMLLFWAENVIIGLYTIPKIVLASGEPPEPGSEEEMRRPLIKGLDLPSPMYLPFFISYYGMFTLAHVVVLMMLFGDSATRKMMKRPALEGLLEAPAIVWEQLSRHGLFIALIALVVSHGISFWRNYVKPRRYIELSKKVAVTLPYGRVILLNLVIVGSAYALYLIGSGNLPLVLLILVKTQWDLAAHLKEHRAAPAGVPAAILSEAPLAESIAKTVDRPLAHYLGGWRLAPGQADSAGWCNGVKFSQENGHLRLRLLDDGIGSGSIAAYAVERVDVHGDGDHIEFIEARLRSDSGERILRFSASGEYVDRIDLIEIQQPAGRPREMKTRTSSFERSDLLR